MKLEFDPMTEAAAVRRMLDALLERQVEITPASATFNTGPAPASAIPLPPAAPCTAAADVFPTAPAAPTAGAATVPPVPPPPVPTIPVPAAPSAPAAGTSPVVVDKNGLPWDERIHSGTKAQNADGSWRQRRGLNNPEYVAGIEAELRAALAISVPAAPASAVPLPPANTAGGAASSSSTTGGTAVSVFTATVPAPPVPPTPQTAPQETHGVSIAAGTSDVPNAAPASSPVPTAPIPTPPVPPVSIAPASTATPISFAQVMSKVTEAVRSGKVSEADVHGALAAVSLGPNDIGKLAKQDEATAGFRLTVAAIIDDIAGGV